MGNANSGRDTWVWTDEKVESLKLLWLDRGLKCSDIGNLLGVTKAAVIGKVARLGLPKRRGATKPRPPRPSRAKGPRVSKPRPEHAVRIVLPKPEKPKGEAWTPIPGTTPVTLTELEAGMCKWPVSEDKPFLFCGVKSIEGKTYCQHHYNWSVGEGTTFERHAISSARSATAQERTYGHQSLMAVL